MSAYCDTCVFNAWDEDEEDYVCQADMVEDDCYRLLADSRSGCPFYRNDNEYEVVRHQM